jgi:hypothetical protein
MTHPVILWTTHACPAYRPFPAGSIVKRDLLYSMIRKSGYRFSEKIMLKQEAKEKWRFNLKSFSL